MKKNSTLVPVVAAALVNGDGRVLMQRRRLGGEHGGLWEFPGGKIEPGESPGQALVREIAEELAIGLDPNALAPLGFACDEPGPPVARELYILLLFLCRRWQGAPRCLGGEEIGWFAGDELAGLAMPPLDVPLARVLAGAI